MLNDPAKSDIKKIILSTFKHAEQISQRGSNPTDSKTCTEYEIRMHLTKDQYLTIMKRLQDEVLNQDQFNCLGRVKYLSDNVRCITTNVSGIQESHYEKKKEIIKKPLLTHRVLQKIKHLKSQKKVKKYVNLIGKLSVFFVVSSEQRLNAASVEQYEREPFAKEGQICFLNHFNILNEPNQEEDVTHMKDFISKNQHKLKWTPMTPVISCNTNDSIWFSNRGVERQLKFPIGSILLTRQHLKNARESDKTIQVKHNSADRYRNRVTFYFPEYKIDLTRSEDVLSNSHRLHYSLEIEYTKKEKTDGMNIVAVLIHGFNKTLSFLFHD